MVEIGFLETEQILVQLGIFGPNFLSPFPIRILQVLGIAMTGTQESANSLEIPNIGTGQIQHTMKMSNQTQ